MKHLISRIAGIAFCLVFMLCMGGYAFAAPTETPSSDAEQGIGSLSDRYESLSVLGNSLTEEEGVVIETRIVVLTSVNRALDNSEVRFSGEVVGPVLNAESGYKWVDLMGSAQATISVFMDDEEAELIKNTGDFHTTGSTLKITGIYHVACPQHQGELDVHASNVEVVEAGGPITHLVEPERMHVAYILCACAVLIIAAYIIIRTWRGRKAKK